MVGRRLGEAVAGVLLFDTPRVSHTQYIGSSDAGNRVRALDAVLCYCLERAGDRGARFFDFGTCSLHAGMTLNDGLYAFKARFGGGASPATSTRLPYALQRRTPPIPSSSQRRPRDRRENPVGFFWLAARVTIAAPAAWDRPDRFRSRPRCRHERRRSMPREIAHHAAGERRVDLRREVGGAGLRTLRRSRAGACPTRRSSAAYRARCTELIRRARPFQRSPGQRRPSDLRNRGRCRS